jgi:peptidoglycan/xylan/chitin deacetylase (PgdA/CDA1 family)
VSNPFSKNKPTSFFVRPVLYSVFAIIIIGLTVIVLWPHPLIPGGAHITPEPLTISPAEKIVLIKKSRQDVALEKGVYFPEIYRGDINRKEVALTFDDGPHPKWTPLLLALLKKLHVRATFFVVGKMVDKYPDLVADEIMQGDEVGNHTYDHISMRKLDEQQCRYELWKGAMAIRRVTGYTPRFFRPPGGSLTPDGQRAASSLHFSSVMWTDNSKDFAYPPGWLLEKRLLSGDHNGAILLCHDGIPMTMNILPNLVARLRAHGYSFVTISVLARHLKESEENKDTLAERVIPTVSSSQ